ncbi:hypothetical protein V8F33_004566 [Rhypophila sp. PSN 637]
MATAKIASPLAKASIRYVINVVMTLPAIIFLDKWGRRYSLILGSFGMMTWLFISSARRPLFLSIVPATVSQLDRVFALSLCFEPPVKSEPSLNQDDDSDLTRPPVRFVPGSPTKDELVSSVPRLTPVTREVQYQLQQHRSTSLPPSYRGANRERRPEQTPLARCCL